MRRGRAVWCTWGPPDCLKRTRHPSARCPEHRGMGPRIYTDNAHDCPCGGTCPGPNADLQFILKLRTGAMHRVAQENDHLRSRLANQETTP